MKQRLPTFWQALVARDEKRVVIVHGVRKFNHQRYSLVEERGRTKSTFTWRLDDGTPAHPVPYYSFEAADWGFGEWMEVDE